MQKKVDVIVLGLSPTGLYAVREAALAGYTVLGVGAPGAPGLWSRFLDDRISAVTPEQRVDAIIHWAADSSNAKPLLIVTSDQDLDAVVSRSADLEQVVDLQGSYTDGLAQRIMDKERFYELCKEQGVSYPTLWGGNVRELAEFDDEITYPSFVKPARIEKVKHLMNGQKGWIIRSKAELESVLPKIPDKIGKILAQEIIPGPESNITLWCGYIDAAGKVRQSFTARKLRQYPPGFGSASLVESEVCRETSETAERFLVKAGYRGIAAAEFKRHPKTGELKIIEVNPRPSLWFSISSKAGVRLVETALAESNGVELPARACQIDGVRWCYTSKDLASRLFYLFNKHFVLPAPNVQRKTQTKFHADVTFAWDDPAPGVAEAIGFIYKALTRFVLGR